MNLAPISAAELRYSTSLTPLVRSDLGFAAETDPDQQHLLFRLDDQLTRPAFRRLAAMMRRFGNELSRKHERALYRLLHIFSSMATGYITDRRAYPLGCGLGKTTAVIAWCAEAAQSPFDYSVMICASRIQDLIDIHDKLLEEGVAEENVGIVHSDKTAPIPSTDCPQDKRILLVTHQRIRGGGLKDDHLFYRGQRRSLTIWDESLRVSEHRFVTSKNLRMGVAALDVECSEGYPTENLQEVYAYLSKCWWIIEAERKDQREGCQDPKRLKMPSREPEDIGRFIEALPVNHENRTAMSALGAFLKLSQMPMRYYAGNDGGGGMIRYEIVIPPDLCPIAVLDASFPISELTKLDKSIRLDEKFDGDVKSYADVTLHLMVSRSGRMSMEQDFRKPAEQRKVSREIVDLVRELPKDEGTLIVTFKHRTEDLKIAERLAGDLRTAGVDTDARLPTGEPRFCWTTYGQHTATNRFTHCRHVIFVGVLHRSDVDLAGAIAGQRDHLTARINGENIKKVQRSDIAETIYQAFNRAACRQTVNGRALRTDAYLMHHDDGVVAELRKAMPGLKATEWSPRHIASPDTEVSKAAMKIAEYLRTRPDHVERIALRTLKAELGLQRLHNKTFQAARDKALVWTGWVVSNQSLCRARAV